MGVCQKNCAIDYSKCLVLTFDMFTCSQQEAACALDCLKSVEVKFSDKEKCIYCLIVAKRSKRTIDNKGCLLADIDIAYQCEKIYGPRDPFADKCNIAFNEACPTFAIWIE